jgi:putative transposase
MSRISWQGQRQYLWRAVDQDGDVIDILLQPWRDRRAAAHRTIMPSVAHDTTQYANSHEPTRQRERGMRRFKSMAQAQRFLSVHGITQNLFRVGCRLLRAANDRMLRLVPS